MTKHMPDAIGRHNAPTSKAAQGVRAVACFEAFKGGIVLMAGLGLLALLHANLQQLAEEIVRHFHLNPASKYPRIFLDLASRPADLHLWQMAGLAFLYAGVRFVEAYGLWKQRTWAQWFSVVSGAVYLPLEVYEVATGLSWVRAGTLALNLAIVVYMARTIMKGRERGSRPKP